MAQIKRNVPTFAMPASMLRNEAGPLDLSSVYYDRATMEEYAKTGEVAYVGQIVTLVETIDKGDGETTTKVTAYSIQNNEGDLQEVGVAYNDAELKQLIDTISSKNAELDVTVNGKDAVGTEGEDGYEPAVEGLVDKVQAINDKIGTVEDDTTVVDMINAVDDKISNKTNVSTFNNDVKYQTEDQVKSTVEAAIAGMSHAAYEKVDSVPAAEDAAENILYLVPSADGKHHDIYAKISGEMVLIDDTDTDLSGYALKTDLHDHANKELLDTYDQTNADIKDAVDKKHSHSFTDDDVDSAIEKMHDHGNLTLLEAIDQDRVDAWDAAERNIINSVDSTQFNVVTDDNNDRKLILLDVAQSKISGLTNSAGNPITLADALDGKVDRVEGSRLINADEIQKLAGLVYDPNTGETSLPISGQITMGQVDGLGTALDGKVDKVDGMGLSANNFTNDLLEKLNGITAGAQVNDIVGIKFNGVDVEVDTDKIANITLPVATGTILGGVKSVAPILDGEGQITNASAIENKVMVAEDGTMEVNSLNVNKLTQTAGEYIILNGGSASA